MKKFQFFLGQEFLRILSLKNIDPVYLTIEYGVLDNKVVLNDIVIPAPIFPYIVNLYNLHDAIFNAAVNNANSLDLIKHEEKVLAWAGHTITISTRC